MIKAKVNDLGNNSKMIELKNIFFSLKKIFLSLWCPEWKFKRVKMRQLLHVRQFPFTHCLPGSQHTHPFQFSSSLQAVCWGWLCA